MRINHQFKGFPKDGLAFLYDLKLNNTSKWFNDNKQRYTENLLKPAQDFVEAFGQLLKKQVSRKIVADTRTNGGGSIFRIYRDIRFSKDKTPYKTHMGIYFWEDRPVKKLESPGFYFHLEEHGAQLHVGQYCFTKNALERYRKAVIHKKWGGLLSEVIGTITGSGKYIVGREHYKNVPKGFDPEHERASLLKYNGLYATSPWISPVMLSQSKLPEVCMAHAQPMVALYQWLEKTKI